MKPYTYGFRRFTVVAAIWLCIPLITGCMIEPQTADSDAGPSSVQSALTENDASSNAPEENFHGFINRVASNILWTYGQFGSVGAEDITTYVNFGGNYADMPGEVAPWTVAPQICPSRDQEVQRAYENATTESEDPCQFGKLQIDSQASAGIHYEDTFVPYMDFAWIGRLTFTDPNPGGQIIYAGPWWHSEEYAPPIEDVVTVRPEPIRGASMPLAIDRLLHFAHRNSLTLVNRQAQEILGCYVNPGAIGTAQTDLGDIYVSAMDYGSNLYQLARKFWPDNPSQPLLSELPKADSIGTVNVDGEPVDLPATYLGGQPFVCQPPVENGRLRWDLWQENPCLQGSPLWPEWVLAAQPSPDCETDPLAMAARTVENPGKSRTNALTYLGWALHMIQDLVLPHHRLSQVGPSHIDRERMLADYFDPADFSVAAIADPRLQALLDGGPERRTMVCAQLGLDPSQLSRSGLHPEAVQAFFEQAASFVPAGADLEQACPPPCSGWDNPELEPTCSNACYHAIAHHLLAKAIADTALLMACFGIDSAS